jgi:uncharacterized protein YceH (UPF0502 family)
MTTILNNTEARVLGSLIEKQVTTPEYYPLTLNSLTLACNQKNNRNPVTSLSETEVAQALETLREKNLAYVYYGSTSRVPKFKHVATEVLHLSQAELGLLCVLLLRGPQTTGELKDRAARLYAFSSLEEIEQTLNGLAARDSEPLAVRLPRQPGQKEARYAHLLSGEIDIEQLAGVSEPERKRSSGGDRIADIERQMEALRTEFETLRAQFDTFKKQFE